uniref:uncharacterized protein LOC120958097 n=1 Tax=Anopheles coluzzii TaxID=1518534 RepID=UPI0020FFDE13|nr:uncharacterized protein LOC120958097 [Anopheles coluzzii]
MSNEIVYKRRKSVVIQRTKKRTSSNDDAFDRRYKAAVKAYHNYMEGLNLILKEKEAKICKILRKRSTPLWFQELTDEQCAICDQLLDAIADDTDERTFHRTSALLRKLGVYPICPNRVLRTSLILCNGNDLSFIWLLLELHYIRSPGQDNNSPRAKDYTINERLLLSAIAHLDMMTTLRGLEKVLPPKKPTRPTSVAASVAETSHRKSPFPRTKSPYLQHQKVFVTGFTVPVKIQPHRDEFLGRYAKYRDPEHIIRNEESRWFTRCGGSRRNLYSSEYYLSADDSQYMCSSSNCSINSAGAVVMDLLNDHIRNMVARVECCQMLCPKHHQLDEQGAKVLEILQRNTSAKQVLMQAVRAQCVQWADEEQQNDAKRQVESLLKRLADEAVTMAILEPTSDCPECWERFEVQKKMLKGQKCNCTESEGSDTLVPESMANVDQRYFKFCDKPVPYEFDHDKIFYGDERDEPTCPIKCAIQRALGVNQTGRIKDTDIDQAIERFAKMTWEEEVKHWQERTKATDDDHKSPSVTTDPLDVKYIEATDVTDLQDLLKRALRRLTENPMYLLATFPCVDRLPILQAWIRDRYDVPIDPREREAALLESKHFWNYLIPRATSVRWPSRKDTGLQLQVNWNYKTKLETTAASMMYKFYRKFKNVQIQEGRIWWTSMLPYHSGPDRFRRTFSAYFPNCEPAMVPQVRPWRPFQYRVMPTAKGTNSRTRF